MIWAIIGVGVVVIGGLYFFFRGRGGKGGGGSRRYRSGVGGERGGDALPRGGRPRVE